ncbi:hypothetical protein CJ030_MR8G019494 [Morella rubra]|uniref:E2F/DP family winged-helix DNA-binding domain-containing protein n=1 Tax=Morella rubra TaxID=262757 RepID=A0A6A1UQ37_9ROSI|nr:hypothetical protein CJ030_MR8G019494 [Morella rubra]
MFTLLHRRNSPALSFFQINPPKPPYILPVHFLTTSTPPPQDASLAKVILSSDPRTLTQTLEDPTILWTSDLVDRVLKRLWNHGPKALHFFKILDHHRAFAHSSSSFDLAIDIGARMRDYKAVWTLVARMRARRLGPGPKTFAIIAERYAAAGKPDRAVKLFLSMHEHGCFQDLNSFNTILDVLCKSKRVEMAYNLFKVLKGRFKADTVSYNIIANGWCLIKRTPKALEVLKEMVERGLEPSLTTYNTMLKGYFRAGQIKEAWEFFLQMKKRKCGLDVVTYTTVVHGFGCAGEIKRARRVFDEMVAEGVLPSVSTYNALIQVLCKKDSVENAILVFEEMVRKGYVPNYTTYNVVIRGLCHAGQMDRALRFMERMKDDDECEPNVQTYNIVIRYFCDAGEIEKGLDVFQKMASGDGLPNLDTYNILISAMFVRKKSGDLLVAGKLLIEMVDRGFLPRKFTFERVLNGLLLTVEMDGHGILKKKHNLGRLPLALSKSQGGQLFGQRSISRPAQQATGYNKRRLTRSADSAPTSMASHSSSALPGDPSSRHHNYSRKQKSLGLLCSNFLDLYDRDDVRSFGLDDAAQRLGVERRRIYDIVNVLESVGVLARKAKNQYNWKGFAAIPKALEELKEEGLNINTFDSNDYAKVSDDDDEDERYSNPSTGSQNDKSNPSAIVKALTKDNRREKSLALLTQNFVKLFVCSNVELISLDDAARLLLGDGHDSSMRSTNFTHTPETRKPAFRWLGCRGNADNGAASNDSRKRMFGNDVTNISFKRNKVDASFDGNLSGDLKVQKELKHERLVDGVDRSNSNLESKQICKTYQFGPFAPTSMSKVGPPENNGAKRVHEWESLASTYRPEYQNEALKDLFSHYVEAWKTWFQMTIKRYSNPSSESQNDKSNPSTIVKALTKDNRRLYDIANVLSSMKLIEKTHTTQTRKPAFRWLGWRGNADNGAASNDSKKRMFGNDATNISYFPIHELPLHRYRWTNFGHTGSCKRSEFVPFARKSYQFRPFAPTSMSKVVPPENNGAKRVPELESLASTYRPQYYFILYCSSVKHLFWAQIDCI